MADDMRVASVSVCLIVLAIAGRPAIADPAAAETLVVRVTPKVTGEAMQFVGASSFRVTEQTKTSGFNISKSWLPLGEVETTLPAGETYGALTREQILKSPARAIDWKAYGRRIQNRGRASGGIPNWKKSLAIGVQTVMNVYIAEGGNDPSARRLGRFAEPGVHWGCPTTQADWNEWWRGCFAFAYYLNVVRKMNMVYWEIGCEPWGNTGMNFRRRGKAKHWTFREGYRSGQSAKDMAKFVGMGSEAIRKACRIAGVKPVIAFCGETYLPKAQYWWDGVLADPVAARELDALSFHGFSFADRSRRLKFLKQFKAYSAEHPHPVTGKPRPLWDTSWCTRWHGAETSWTGPQSWKGPIDTDDLGYALLTVERLIDENELDVQMSIIFVTFGGKGKDGRRTGLVDKDRPTKTFYAMRMMARGLAGGKERLAVQVGPGRSYASGDGKILATAARDKSHLYVTVVNRTADDRSLNLSLAGLKIRDAPYVIRKLDKKTMDEKVASGALEDESLTLRLDGFSAVQLVVRRAQRVDSHDSNDGGTGGRGTD